LIRKEWGRIQGSGRDGKRELKGRRNVVFKIASEKGLSRAQRAGKERKVGNAGAGVQESIKGEQKKNREVLLM